MCSASVHRRTWNIKKCLKQCLQSSIDLTKGCPSCAAVLVLILARSKTMFSLWFSAFDFCQKKKNINTHHSVPIERILANKWRVKWRPPLNMSMAEHEWIKNDITWNPNASEIQSIRSRIDLSPWLWIEDMCGIGRPSVSLIASMAPLIYIIYRVTKIKTYFSLSQKSRNSVIKDEWKTSGSSTIASEEPGKLRGIMLYL